jgi:hypothetical protein
MVILHVHAFLESANVDRENPEQPLERFKDTQSSQEIADACIDLQRAME